MGFKYSFFLQSYRVFVFLYLWNHAYFVSLNLNKSSGLLEVGPLNLHFFLSYSIFIVGGYQGRLETPKVKLHEDLRQAKHRMKM